MLPAQFTIRDKVIAPGTVLAPMAGVTDTVFRRMIRSLGGCGLIMTEFTSAECITRNNERTSRYLFFEPDEHPITGQLFGAVPAVMAKAAAMVERYGFDIVDINLGCPAKKVVKCGGSGLLRDLKALEEVLRAVRSAVTIPLTVKIRAGWDDKSIVAVEVAKMAEQIGIEGIAVHPRTRLQAYTGHSDWNIIRDVKQAVRMPVIGNGDINSPEDAMRMLRETGCDAVMIGRAASNNPWIFQQITQYSQTGTFNEPNDADRYRLLSTYFRNLVDTEWPDAIGKMKQFVCYFTHGVRNGSELRLNVHRSKTSGEILDRVDSFFADSVTAGGI
jgi:tRNA-dihydrouridine synthase B